MLWRVLLLVVPNVQPVVKQLHLVIAEGAVLAVPEIAVPFVQAVKDAVLLV